MKAICFDSSMIFDETYFVGDLSKSAFFFFNCYLAAPRPILGHSQGDSLTNPMLITAFVHIRPEGHREPPNEVGSLSPAERLAASEPGTFRFLLQCLNPLGHSPQKYEFWNHIFSTDQKQIHLPKSRKFWTLIFPTTTRGVLRTKWCIYDRAFYRK